MGHAFSKLFGNEDRTREADERARAAEESAKDARLQAMEACRLAAELNARMSEMMAELRKMQETVSSSQEGTKESEERIKRMEESAKKAAEQAEQALARMAEAEESVRKAREEAGQEAAAKEEILRFWKAGIQPAEIPTEEEIQAMKDKAQYDDSIFHIAIAGVSGSGKSSLINAFRGLRSKKPGAAPVGVTETTTEMARYPPSNSEHPLAWYDIPGACTRKFSGWEYFKKQGLYVFDAIIVLFDGRFTETDVTILENCRRFGIPSFIVRSKADLQILNIINEEESDDEEENGHDARCRQQQSETAKTKLVEKTQTSVKDNLEEAQLPDQRVYIISANNLRTLVENKRPQKVIHEIELLRDIYLEAHGSRASDALDLAIRDLAKWEGVFHQDRSPRSQYAEFVLQDWEHDL
ncbi:P-loop containing nucleoside triphosphate hydrolase protein [Scleroderma yunnanense]